MSILYEERLDGALPDVDRTSVLMALREHVPGLEILHTDEEIIPYECDGLSAYRTRPLLVVLPKQMEQVTAILAVCHRLRVPVVTRGAGTGLSGGALPLEKGVLLVMARFKEILDINPVGRRARVQPGVRNLAISQAVAPHNLYYAPDPSSQIACSIGGNVAENAGGVHCLKYGLTVHNLLKIEVQTLDGEALTLGSDALDSPGFDLLALFTGSEGMLGVTTEVTVKLLPKPPVARVLLASFDSVEKAGLAVGDIIANGIIPGGLEMMDNLSIRAAEDFIHAGYPVDAEAILLCELDGVESDVQEDCERVNDILLKAGATEDIPQRHIGNCSIYVLVRTQNFQSLLIFTFLQIIHSSGIHCIRFIGIECVLPHTPTGETEKEIHPAYCRIEFVKHVGIFCLILTFNQPFAPIGLLFTINNSQDCTFIALKIFIIYNQTAQFLPPLRYGTYLYQLRQVRNPVLHLLPDDVARLIHLDSSTDSQ